jgi:hypothetical protein
MPSKISVTRIVGDVFCIAIPVLPYSDSDALDVARRLSGSRLAVDSDTSQDKYGHVLCGRVDAHNLVKVLMVILHNGILEFGEVDNHAEAVEFFGSYPDLYDVVMPVILGALRFVGKPE